MAQTVLTIKFHIEPADVEITATKSEFSGKVGVPLNDDLGLTGGQAPYSVIVNDPAGLPPGVNLESDGRVSGTPTSAGDFTTSITVNDSGA